MANGRPWRHRFLPKRMTCPRHYFSPRNRMPCGVRRPTPLIDTHNKQTRPALRRRSIAASQWLPCKGNLYCFYAPAYALLERPNAVILVMPLGSQVT